MKEHMMHYIFSIIQKWTKSWWDKNNVFIIKWDM